MKLTKSKLKQIIKEELNSLLEVYDSAAAERGDYDYNAGAGHKAYRDEWDLYTTSDMLKHGKKAWFSFKELFNSSLMICLSFDFVSFNAL